MAATDSRLFLRRRDVAEDLGVSERQILKWEREGLITPVPYAGLRVVPYRAEDIKHLAAKLTGEAAT